MKGTTRKWVLLIIGWFLLLGGVAGLFLPVLQGALMILVGLTLLSYKYPWARRILYWIKERFPRLGSIAEKARAKARGFLR